MPYLKFSGAVYISFKIRVVLTIDAPLSKHTIYFDEPIPKPRFLSCLSCSLYNSRNTLKTGGYMTYKIGGKNVNGEILNARNYNFETLATYLVESFSEEKPFRITAHCQHQD